jgi:hypothetical protein
MPKFGARSSERGSNALKRSANASVANQFRNVISCLKSLPWENPGVTIMQNFIMMSSYVLFTK